MSAKIQDVILVHPFWNTRFVTVPFTGWRLFCPNCKVKLFTGTISEEIVCYDCKQKIGWEKIPEFDGHYKFYDH